MTREVFVCFEFRHLAWRVRSRVAPWGYRYTQIFRDVPEADDPLVRPGVGQIDANGVYPSKSSLDFIRPFDQNDGFGIAEIVEAQPLEIGDGVEPVRVDMIEVEPARILVDQDEGRAGHVLPIRGPRPGGNPLDQMGLAAAQRSANREDLAAPELAPIRRPSSIVSCGDLVSTP